jgi:Carboxypeptidase regulatory-like domain/TonB dependent receptor
MTQISKWSSRRDGKRLLRFLNNKCLRCEWCLRFATVLVLVLPASYSLVAQQTTADVVGTVTDTSGAVIPGATVALTNLDTGETQTTFTTQSGDYVFNLLKPNEYSLTITSNGFKSLKIPSISISTGDRAREDAHLEIGATNQTVEVRTLAPALQTDSSVLSTTITNEAVQSLPLNGRNFIDLARLVPGANAGLPGAPSSGTRPDDRRQSASISVNGQTDLINDEMIDGMDNNERIIGLIGVRPSIEAIQEVRVQTNTYTAEVGRTAGGIINIISKSGTNQFHGSAYEYFQNTALNAYPYNFGAVLPKPAFHQNQFGGSFGGPIRRNKTFFFADYEDLRIAKANNPAGSTVPTAYEVAHIGDFSDNPSLGRVVIPASQFDNAGLQYFKLFPTPNQPGFANNYISASKYSMDAATVDARVDHRFNDSNLFYARYTYNQVSGFLGGLLPAVTQDGITIQPGGNSNLYAGPSKDNATNGALNYIHTITPHLLLELKAGYTYFYNATLPLNNGVNVNTAFNQPNINIDSGTSGLGIVNVTGLVGLGDGAPLPLKYIENTYQYMGAVTYTHGNHNVKMGAGIIRRQATATKSSPGRGQWTVASLPQLLQGNFTALSRNNTLVRQHYRTWEPSFYVQDDWHILRDLTLNLGIRYDIFTPYTAVKNQISNFDPVKAKIIVAGVDGTSATAGIQTDYSNLAPRVGFAYTLRPTMVVRGGFGLSFVPENVTGSAALRNQPFVFAYGPCAPGSCIGGFTKLAQGGPLPIPSDYVNPTGSIPAAEQLTFRSTYLEQFNLTIEKDWSGNVFTASYVGMLGRHISPTSGYDLNSPPLNTSKTPNTLRPYYSVLPGISTISYIASTGAGSYNALQTSVERRARHGLTYIANYTWAHGLNDTPDYGGAEGWGVIPSRIHELDYGNSDVDVADQFAATVNYELPFGTSATGLKGVALKGWQANALAAWQTGQPFTVVNSSNRTGTTLSTSSDRPNQLGPARLSNRSVTKWFDTSKFAAQPLGRLGNEARNSLYGPPSRHLDVSLFKTFPIHERATLEFRAELFNVTNTASFTGVNANLGASNFGTVSNLTNNYVPRSAQFALKVQF